jgi:hypothetical protein
MHLHRTIEHLYDEPEDSVIILGGDFNQIQHSAIQALGLQVEFSEPTHLGHSLDRIYSSVHIYNCCRAFQSAVRTGHMAVIASVDHVLFPSNKKKTVCTFRRRTPAQHAAFLSRLESVDWTSVVSSSDADQAFHNFYEIIVSLLDTFYPIKSITVSDKDPYFITPEIKFLLRTKNKLMRSGKLQAADSLSRRIGERIARCNASYFSGKKPTSRELWCKVRKVMGKELRGDVAGTSNFTATMLNDHYARISTDPHYDCPQPKLTATNVETFFSEQQIFHILHKGCPTTAGFDGLPAWFLRLAAPCISLPIAHLFNRSISSSYIPDTWKISIIHPIPKVVPPVSCADFRPISITPILCRVLEKLVVKSFIYPLYELPQYQELFSDQFAFRPTGSTTAALVSLFHHISDMLSIHTHVHVISLDFSKAFDTARHSSLASKLATLPLPDCIYNWLLNFLSNRQHCTKYDKLISELASINASFVQGSVTGPTSFVINISDLKAIILSNILLKYADDIDLVIPPTNADSIDTELRGIADWAIQNNLVLNYSKSHHMVVRRPRFPRDHVSIRGISSIDRVYEMKILGVTFSDTLTISPHIKYLSVKSAQTAFALRTLHNHGLSGRDLWTVTQAYILSRLTYACSAWWGFCSLGERDQLAAVVTRLVKKNYLPPDQPTLHEMVATADNRLFHQIVASPAHVLAPLIPPSKSHSYNLRKRPHDLQVPLYQTNISDKNFITRTILKLNQT